eukprot:4144389-Amphidinium_carterae.1
MSCVRMGVTRTRHLTASSSFTVALDYEVVVVAKMDCAQLVNQNLRCYSLHVLLNSPAMQPLPFFVILSIASFLSEGSNFKCYCGTSYMGGWNMQQF